MTGAFGVAALAITGMLVFGNSNIQNLFLAKATPTSSGSYTLTADDFSNGAGNITKGGDTWHFEKVTKDGSTVSVGGVFYTVTRSGSSKADQRRGDGYTRLVFSGLDISHSAGLVIYEKDLAEGIKNTIVNITSDLDLTVGGTIASSSRRGLQFAQQEGDGKYFSFTSLTVNYACTDVVPEIEITDTDVQLGVGENLTLHTERHDIFDGDTVSVAWSSDDDDVVSVTDAGVITGVAAGTTDITVTMTVNGKDYTDSIEVTVTAAQAEVKEMAILNTSAVQGAGIFCRFDPSSASTTAALLDTYTASVTLEFASETANAINHYNFQDKGDSSYTAYVVCDNAVGLNDKFTITVDFKDNPNNVIYRALFHFDKGAIAPEIELAAAAFSVDEGADLEITASKASFIEGTPTFAFTSLDTSIFTVTANNNVATVHGVAKGSATLRVTMTVGEKQYVLEKTIAVTEAGVKHLITWYTEGTGDQANHWLGAGIWTWVNYGALGYTWATFSVIKAQITVSYASEPSTTVSVDTISDDIGAATSARVYILAGAAYNTGVLTMSLPDANGVTYTGTITFESGVATAYNAGL